MTRFILLICFVSTICVNFAFASPRISFNDLLVQAELNPQSVISARAEAHKLNIPVTILSAKGIMVDVKSVENGKPVYAVFTNFANPYDGGYCAFYEEVLSIVSFSNSKVEYADGRSFDNTGGIFNPKVLDSSVPAKVVMITESTHDRVYIFSAQDGTFIDTAFIPSTRPQLGTPKVALQHYDGTSIIVCDQITDVVQRFNFNGTYSGFYAPATGPNTSIVDNMRGMCYRPNNNILVSVGSSANSNTVQQFDPTGTHIGTFANSGLVTPFDILERENDVLVSNFSGTNRVNRFDLSGTNLGSFYTGSQFGISQQLERFPNGYVAVAAFQTPTGVAILDSIGAFIKLLTGATGNRGVYILGNGNIITTNATGAYILDSATGGLISTAMLSPNFQYATEYTFANPTLKLTINFELCPAPDTITAEVRSGISPYPLVESKVGIGGASLPQMIEFASAANGTPYYLVVKGRNRIATWSGSTPSFLANYISYNYTYANTQAFGNNMILVGGKWSLYQGDVNQDEIIDVTDVVAVYNDAINFTSGYVPTDLNCDDFVDVSDVTTTYNNNVAGISVIAP